MEIDADDETAWPPEALALLNERLPALRAYWEHDRNEVRRSQENTPWHRVRPIPNPWKSVHDDTLAELDLFLAPHSQALCRPWRTARL